MSNVLAVNKSPRRQLGRAVREVLTSRAPWKHLAGDIFYSSKLTHLGTCNRDAGLCSGQRTEVRGQNSSPFTSPSQPVHAGKFTETEPNSGLHLRSRGRGGLPSPAYPSPRTRWSALKRLGEGAQSRGPACHRPAGCGAGQEASTERDPSRRHTAQPSDRAEGPGCSLVTATSSTQGILSQKPLGGYSEEL